jgi:hypothetical protein
VFGEAVAVAGVDLPRPDDTGEAGEKALALGTNVAAEFAEPRLPVTPEVVLTELQGVDAVLAATMPGTVKPVVGLRPPLVGLKPLPSNGERATAPGPPLVQGPGLVASLNAAGVIWELPPMDCPKSAPSGEVALMPPWIGMPIRELPTVWPKSAPSGDVVSMLPGLDVSVCAALSPAPSGLTARIMAAATRLFISISVVIAYPTVKVWHWYRPHSSNLRRHLPKNWQKRSAPANYEHALDAIMDRFNRSQVLMLDVPPENIVTKFVGTYFQGRRDASLDASRRGFHRLEPH